jgi:hypothetical protein
VLMLNVLAITFSFFCNARLPESVLADNPFVSTPKEVEA